MSSNKSRTRAKKESNAFGAWTAPCCQPCTPWKVRAFKRGAEQRADAAEEQTTVPPYDMSAYCDVGCGCEGSDELPDSARATPTAPRIV